jgi:hypothetical protein
MMISMNHQINLIKNNNKIKTKIFNLKHKHLMIGEILHLLNGILLNLITSKNKYF